MTSTDKALALSWLSSVARDGRLPGHVPDSVRAFLATFLSTAIESIPEAGAAEELAVITVGKLQGEFGSAK